jgi:DNA-binding response OmpR family regulator
MKPFRVLLVDDDQHTQSIFQMVLRHHDLQLDVCDDAETALVYLESHAPDVIVLDIMLPGIDGLEVMRRLRRDTGVYVLLLTARSEETDRVIGLTAGADDYLVKPFSPRELAARVRAVLRRAGGATRTGPGTSPLVIDDGHHAATWHGHALDLTRYEFRLLQVLAAEPGRVFSRSQLLDLVWDRPDASFDRTVDTHIKTLRGKFHAATPGLDPLATLRGEGYAYREPA